VEHKAGSKQDERDRAELKSGKPQCRERRDYLEGVPRTRQTGAVPRSGRRGEIPVLRSHKKVLSSKERLVMTVRENVHQLIDTLPEERLDDVLDYLADLGQPDESISAETRAAIEEGVEDIRNGRTISLGDYRRARGL